MAKRSVPVSAFIHTTGGGIHYLQVQFGICDLMMAILMKWQFFYAVYYKIGLICKNKVNLG